MLTSRGLAYWIMDDGYWDGSTVRSAKAYLSLEEVELLTRLLFSKFNLVTHFVAVKDMKSLTGP